MKILNSFNLNISLAYHNIEFNKLFKKYIKDLLL
jgi:hypothetical protein